MRWYQLQFLMFVASLLQNRLLYVNYKKNEEVKVIPIVNLWAEIFYKNRKTYVFSKYLKNVETTELDVVEDVWVTIKVVVV